METHESSNDVFGKAVRNDNIGIAPDPAIESRLNYYFDVQHSSRKIHQNGFSGFLGVLLTGKSLLWKTGLVAAFSTLFLLKSPDPMLTKSLNHDSISEKTILVDSNAMAKDTSFY